MVEMNRTANIILIDDDSEALLSLARSLKANGLDAKVHAASTAKDGLKLFEEFKPEVAVVDLSLDEKVGVESGFSLIKNLLESDRTTRIIVLTGHAGVEFGVRALNIGAAAFLEKPANISHISALILDAISQSRLMRAYNELQVNTLSALSPIIGNSKVIIDIRAAVSRAAQTSQPIIILGETGTGKGLCAKSVHDLSQRRSKNFVRYQPNFLTADLVNSELFGHRRGAFTGATEDRRGLLADADGGTLFLDEVDELPPETQVTLLGVLQEQSFRRVGSNTEERVSFRLISATNNDINKALDSRKLRRDFYHRIAHTAIELPPLRERKEDIPALAISFLEKLKEREELTTISISESSIDKLTSYDWPGNVRELQSVVEGGCYLAHYDRRAELLPEDIRHIPGQAIIDQDLTFHDAVLRYKVKLINDALTRANGNQIQAARSLGLDRSTVRRILGKND